MKHGDEVKCPMCNKETFAVKKAKIENWKKTGEYLACSACGVELQDLKEEDKESDKESDKHLSKLADFLDTEPEKKVRLTADEAETHFCRDCKYYVKHPFLSRCELHKKEVTPMDDCSDFTRLEQ
jgi:protein-arginine kinase activator protein McsA